MKRVAVLYATREGQTRRIAEHIGATLRIRGFTADVHDVRHLPTGFDLGAYAAAILAASVHMGRHEAEMVTFVKTHRAELESLATGFLSVSLAEGRAEDPSATPEARAQAVTEVREWIDAFFEETGWHPGRVRPMAGALLYQQYGLLKRFVMRMIAKKTGGDTDTSGDHEYTDWEALDRFADEMADAVGS